MSRYTRVVTLSLVVLFGSVGTCAAQYGGTQYGRPQPATMDQVRAAVRTLLLQVDYLVEDLEIDLVRAPHSERLMQVAYDVRDEVEHLAASVERGVDYDHMVHDFQEFDVQWHRLTRLATRFGADNRHLQRNLSRISQTDSDLHRLLRVPAPVNVEEVRSLAARLQQASEHLREDVQIDLRGLRFQRAILAHAVALEESTEHMVASIDRGVDVRHMREDFEAIDEAWSQLADSLRELSSVRYDHVMRAAANVAAAEGHLRAALGLDANPNQFTRFRPPPSDVRRTLPYAASGPAAPVPSGWRVTPSVPAGPSRTFQPGVNRPSLSSDADPGFSLMLGFLFGGDGRDQKSDRQRSVRPHDAERPHDHESDHDRPALRTVTTSRTAPAKTNIVAPLPAKPVDPATQEKIDKHLSKLSAVSRTAVIAQQSCLVKGELLGVNGVPIKVKVKDASGTLREVFVCCDDCEDALQEHPERYLARLKVQE